MSMLLCKLNRRKERVAHRGGIVAEEEGLVGQHVREHLQVILAHLDNLVSRVQTDARGAHLLQTLDTITKIYKFLFHIFPY